MRRFGRTIRTVPLLAALLAAGCDDAPDPAAVTDPSAGFGDLLGELTPIALAGGPYVSEGTVRFDGGRSFDPDGSEIAAYAWDFGDGNMGSGMAPTHTYAVSGLYAVTLTVTDGGGQTSRPGVTLATVARRPGTPVMLSGAGNIAKCSNDRDEATATLLDGLDGWVAALGDNAFPSGSLADYTDCYEPTWGRHRSRTFPVLGNHEYDLGNADGAFDYFADRTGPRGLGYYSVDIGAWHVIVLNDNGAYVPFGARSAQERWLLDDLAANDARCTLAMWHTPLFVSSNSPGGISNGSRRVLWEHLYAAGADVVLNGQVHHYERMSPMRPDGTRDDATGIRQFNAGTGGESSALPTVAIHPNSEVRSAAFGVLRLTLRDGGYDWEFLPIPGESFGDAGSGQCH